MSINLKDYRELLTTYLSSQVPRVIGLIVLLAIDIALQLINPQLLRSFIDIITSSGPQGSLPMIALLFVAVALLQQGGKIWATYLSEQVGWIATNALRIDLTRHLLMLDLSFHKLRTPGELIERVDGDINDLAQFFSRFIVQVIGNLLLLIGILIVLSIQDWRAGLPLSLFMLISLVVINIVRSIGVPEWKAYRQSSADLYGFLEERITGTEDIRSNGAQAYMLRRLYAYTRKRLQASRTARLISSIPWSIPTFALSIERILAFLLIAWFYQAGTMTLGMAFLIYFYAELAFEPIMAITHQLEDFQKASASIMRIRELRQIKSKLDDGPGITYPAGALSITFEQVSFGYGEEEMIVQDISFHIEPGEIVGLLGRTGSGKTTIMRLLTRLYDPDHGVVRLGDSDLRTARLADLCQVIGMVTQDVQLFHATVRDNLTFFDHNIDDSRIIQALIELGLQAWYRALPNGLDTILAPNGGGLSAGEAQLLAFTRIFLRNPAIVILDEASSRLDPATESLLEQAIDKLLRGRTAVIIAHRLRTVQRADTIIVLEDGRICEYGARTQLSNDTTSRFSRLLQTAHEEMLA